MKSSLRNLVTAEEAYFSDHNNYSRSLSATNQRLVYIVPSPGVTLTVTYTRPGGWTGRATHDWLPGLSCIIYVGSVPPSKVLKTRDQGLLATDEGSPTCDAPPAD